jgi:hypothetical protein
MERRFEEKIREMKEEELARILKRKGKDAVLAALEILRRFESGKKIGKELFVLILRMKTEGKMKSKEKEIKKRVYKIVKKNFLDEEVVLAIVECEELKEERERMARKYVSAGGKDKYLLRRIVESSLSQETKNLAALRILELQPTKDELISIFLETTDFIQARAFKLLLEMKLEKEDLCYLIMNSEPDFAEEFFKKMKREKMIEKLEKEDFDELRLAEDQKIARWATKKLIEELKKIKKKLIKEMKTKKEKWERESMWFDIDEIEREIEDLKKELKGERKISTEISSLALASDFF